MDRGGLPDASPPCLPAVDQRKHPIGEAGKAVPKVVRNRSPGTVGRRCPPSSPRQESEVDDEPIEPEKCEHGIAMDRRCEDCEYDAWNTESN